MLKSFGLSTVFAVMSFGQAPAIEAGGNAMKGLPYSAEQVVEVSGVQVNSAPSVRMYRDSAGRTRTERPMYSGPEAQNGKIKENPIMIEITDPVAGTQYTLDTRNKVAHRQRAASPGGSTDLKIPAELLARLPRMTPPPPPGGLDAPSQFGQSMPQGGRPETSVEKLGTKTLEGVMVEGTRRTTTLLRAQAGDQPIVTVSESWYSPELKLTMLSIEGERTTKLINVDRGEPVATLFTPPADYKVVE